MTQWQSMFDAGACTVTVVEKVTTTSTTLWTGRLAKGGQSPSFTNSGGIPLSVDVDQDGVITLFGDGDFGVPDLSGTSVMVTGLYSISDQALRVIDISAANGGFGCSAYDNTEAAPQLLSDAGWTFGPTTPSSATFLEQTTSTPSASVALKQAA